MMKYIVSACLYTVVNIILLFLTQTSFFHTCCAILFCKVTNSCAIYTTCFVIKHLYKLAIDLVSLHYRDRTQYCYKDLKLIGHHLEMVV